MSVESRNMSVESSNMSDRPAVRWTYGKSRPLSSASQSMVFSDYTLPSSSSSCLFGRSSSPPSSDRLQTPPSSSPASNHPYAGRTAEDEADCDAPTSLSLSRAKLKSALGPEGSTSKISLFRGASTHKQSNLKSFFTTQKRPQRPLQPTRLAPPPSVFGQPSKPSTGPSKSSTGVSKPSPGLDRASLRSLHLQQTRLTHLPLLHTCQECQMSYVRASDDEGLHVRHHARVVRGIVWDGLGRGRATGAGKGTGTGSDQGRPRCQGGHSALETGWRVVSHGVEFGPRAGTGRIVVCDGSWRGSKLDEILSTVDTVLSSPPLPGPILSTCKIFLFLTSSPPPSSSSPSSAKRPRLPRGLFGGDATPASRARRREKDKERVVAVAVAQPIKWAMRVLQPAERDRVPAVDSGGGVLCDPAPLDTRLGIHRLFTVPAYRSCGLARHLLDAACRQTVYACTFCPDKGEVAFSQPTDSGRSVMDSWGRGGVRVFVDDESQL